MKAQTKAYENFKFHTYVAYLDSDVKGSRRGMQHYNESNWVVKKKVKL